MRLGRSILVLRQRRGWRQQDLADRSGMSQSAISDMERGRIDRYTLQAVRQVLRALDASVNLDPMWGGRGDLDRLLDADHARLMQEWADRHRRSGWDVWNEASYSIFGERGRIDQLAFHPGASVLEVTEIKTGIWDVQDTLGRLDAKIRLAARVAAERGWRADWVVGAPGGHGRDDLATQNSSARRPVRAVLAAWSRRPSVGAQSASRRGRPARLHPVATYQSQRA